MSDSELVLAELFRRLASAWAAHNAGPASSRTTHVERSISVDRWVGHRPGRPALSGTKPYVLTTLWPQPEDDADITFTRPAAWIGSELSPNLTMAIDSSRSILELPDDWDGEGSQGYQKDTWEQAIEFLRKCAICFYGRTGTWIPAPRIQAGPSGSIDVHWRLNHRELLVNISRDSVGKATFYGDHRNDFKIKGEIDLESAAEWLMIWLMK